MLRSIYLGLCKSSEATQPAKFITGSNTAQGAHLLITAAIPRMTGYVHTDQTKV